MEIGFFAVGAIFWMLLGFIAFQYTIKNDTDLMRSHDRVEMYVLFGLSSLLATIPIYLKRRNDRKSPFHQEIHEGLRQLRALSRYTLTEELENEETKLRIAIDKLRATPSETATMTYLIETEEDRRELLQATAVHLRELDD